MKLLKQSDPRWSYKKLGTCNVTIGSHGCFVVCIAMISNSLPDWVNLQLTKQGGYSKGCLVSAMKAANIFNLEYNAIRNKAMFYPTIAETDHYKSSGIPQHFFVLLSKTRMIDPLTGKESSIKYKIISYRNIRVKVKEGSKMIKEKFYKLKTSNIVWYDYKKWSEFVADGGTTAKITKVDFLPGHINPKTLATKEAQIVELAEANRKYVKSNKDLAEAMDKLLEDNKLLKKEIKRLNIPNDKPKEVKHWFSGFLEWLQKIFKSKKK